MAITHFIDSCAPEIARARIRSLTNRIPESFPVLVYGDTRPHNFVFYNSQTGVVESYSGNASYSLRVTLGQVQSGPTDGTYSVTCGSTGTVPALADAETLQDALNLLTTIISDGGVVVTGTFPNFIVTWNTLGVKTAFTADASLLVPSSGISLVTMQTGSASVVNQVAVVIRQAAISSQATWSTITSPNNGWTGTITTNTAGALNLLTSQGEQVGEVLEVNTLLTAEVLDATNIPVSYYQTPVVLRAKNLDPNGTITPGTPTYALGDILYGNALGGLSKLPGNTTATLKFLSQTGTGAISAVPSWVDPDTQGVTSVALAMPADLFTVSGSPVTSAGTLTATVKTQVANTVWAGPTTGIDASPAFRSLVVADLPSLTGVAVTALAGTANQITASASVGSVALSLAGPHAFASLTSTALLLGAGTSAITPADLTYSTPTLTAPSAFSISGAGSISIIPASASGLGIGIAGSAATKVKVYGYSVATTPVDSTWTTTAAPPLMMWYSEGNTTGSTDYQVSNAGGTSLGINFLMRRARGTLAVPLALADTDQVGNLLGSVYDGAAFRNTAGINFVVDGAVSDSVAPQLINFQTGTATTRSTRFTITAAGILRGGAGNMTIQSGTGNSRTLTLQTTTSGGTATNALVLSATQNATFGGSITTSTPTSGTAAAWKLGTIAVVSPTSPNRTLEVDVAGTIYYIACKTTNN